MTKIQLTYQQVFELLWEMPCEQAYAEAPKLAKHLGAGDRFRIAHAFGLYASDESISGAGSELAQTVAIRGALPGFLRDLGVRNVLDAPCGDFNWMSHVDLGDIEYTGVDVVPAIVSQNCARFGAHFHVADITQDDLPYADLILCRDVLVHLDNATVISVLKNFRRTGAVWLLTTTFRRGANVDIETGDFRPIDLRVAPFDLGAPNLVIDEACTLGNGKFADKSLALWPMADIGI